MFGQAYVRYREYTHNNQYRDSDPVLVSIINKCLEKTSTFEFEKPDNYTFTFEQFTFKPIKVPKVTCKPESCCPTINYKLTSNLRKGGESSVNLIDPKLM